jgi:tripartite-type tricarboxylate transporter receptor subunit TctC
MRLNPTSWIRPLALLAAASLHAEPCAAQTAAYPVKPLRIIVASGTGGGLDIVARMLAPILGAGMGQSIVVDNRAGASGSIGVELAAHAPPDGYTVVFLSATSVGYAALYQPRYDLGRDFAPVSQVTAGPYVLVVTPALAARSVSELIAYARSVPGKLNYASTGNGSLVHLATELLAVTEGLKLVHVPYKGLAAAYTDVLAGQIDMTFALLGSAFPLIRNQRLRALAVTGAERAHSAPELPTMIESGVAGFTVTQWHGLLAPRGTPQPAIARLHREIVRALQRPEVAARFAADGTDAVGSTPAQFAAHLEAERKKWSQVIEQAGIRAER